MAARSSAGMGNSLGAKSPTVRLQMVAPAVTLARISPAIFSISDPIRFCAIGERPRFGSPPGRSRVSFDMGALTSTCGEPRPERQCALQRFFVRRPLQRLARLGGRGPAGGDVLAGDARLAARRHREQEGVLVDVPAAV